MTRSLVLLVIIASSAFSQSSYFCIGGATFTTNELAMRAGMIGTITVSFDVHNFKPQNIRTIRTANDVADLFSDITINNLKRLTFFYDTTGVSLSFHYEHLNPGRLTQSYARVMSDSAIDLVFRMHDGMYGYTGGDPIPWPQTGDTILCSTHILGTPATPAKSDIVVERVFEDGSDSCAIIKNNHPEFTTQILAAAREINLDQFLVLQHPNLQPWEISRDKFPDAYNKTFMVRVYILRRIPPCNLQTEF